MRPVSGLAILSLNPSLQMKLTDDYAAGSTDAHKSPVDERYRLITTVTRKASSREPNAESAPRLGLRTRTIKARHFQRLGLPRFCMSS